MKPYTQLTERGRARRLRSLARNALQHYDLEVARLRLVDNGFNAIFRVDTRSGEKWILRVTLPEGGHSRDHVTAEMDWLAALARDTDLSVPRPLPARDGALLVKAEAAGVPEARLCEVFSWVPGTNLAKHITPANMARFGALSARLHAHAHTYRPPAGLELLAFERVFPFPEPVVLFDEAQTAMFTAGQRALFEQARDWAQAAIAHLQASGEPMRLIHGDLHQWNVRCARGRLSPIDFEDLMWGWPVQDIATTLYYFEGDKGAGTDHPYEALQEAFAQGYRQVSPWPERYPGEINAFIAARGLGMLNFVLQNNDLWGVNLERSAAAQAARLRRLGVETWRVPRI